MLICCVAVERAVGVAGRIEDSGANDVATALRGAIPRLGPSGWCPAVSILDQLVAAVGDNRGAGAADRLCEACVGLLEVDAAALSLILDGANTGTLGASGAPARLYDELQFTFGEGPCL